MGSGDKLRGGGIRNRLWGLEIFEKETKRIPPLRGLGGGLCVPSALKRDPALLASAKAARRACISAVSSEDRLSRSKSLRPRGCRRMRAKVSSKVGPDSPHAHSKVWVSTLQRETAISRFSLLRSLRGRVKSREIRTAKRTTSAKSRDIQPDDRGGKDKIGALNGRLPRDEERVVQSDLETIMADSEGPSEVKEDVADIAPFDPSKKKKKKKVVIQDPADDDVDKLVEKTENLSVADSVENTFSGLKKKKKKPVQTEVLSDENENVGDDLDDHIGEDEEGEGIVLQPQLPWEGSDRDYEYEELLGRVFNILRENNPELAGDRRRTVMRPPQVLREGTKKTVFVNFMDLCKTMHRQPEHVMTFLLAEMGTSGSLDGLQRLVVKGRFAPKNFEGILRRYVNEYVICNGCKSPDTILSKENRLFFLRCEKCGSGRSVAPIKAGFVARVGRRKTGT
ncbi:hypothetical protein RHGRI_002613 [Rhododendron griersonianum]|uniref:Eukaryotic translation initiation factor 2 subunit beta n=1 Tax=Rhododendron griersonianum TaxID=479676 RepID=A0AAV6LPM6_9ERIC|nr:hypothetical protein RHGRI_002613 [Rhododendron griersonianum]